MRSLRSLLVSFLLLAAFTRIHAEITLPSIISNHMVLQKAAKVPIWGKANPGEEVTVTLDGRAVKSTADAEGKWKVFLSLSDTGPGPFEMTIQGTNLIKISDVLVGEVWLASGQSNMEWPLVSTTDGKKEVAASSNPLIRQFQVSKATSREPLDDCKGSWVAASPGTSGGFSGVGYYFAKSLQNELKIPVGIIHSSWGGTPSESWTSVAAIDSIPVLKASRLHFWGLEDTYAERKKAFVETFGKWLKETGREDRPTDATLFAGASASPDGWIPVTLPGKLDAPGLPKSGVVWLRAEVDVPTAAAGKALPLDLGLFDAFDSVYWNGKLITKTTHENYPGLGWHRIGGGYTVPGELVAAGKNIFAIRVYEPVGPTTFTNGPATAGTFPFQAKWHAKPEYELPALNAAAPRILPHLPRPQIFPGYLFNAMINPLVPCAIRGVIWYQGESNAGRATQYRTAFPALIDDWRKQWKQERLPFYFCQIANYQPKKQAPGESALAELRYAQTSALKLPDTGQAVLIDLGESADIHPRNKKDVGERLAKIALARDYGQKIPFSGPVYQSAKVEGGKIQIRFTHTDGGLVAKPLPTTYDVRTSTAETAPLIRNSPDSQLEGFAICGIDKQWVWADAKIDGTTVVVWSDKVPSPTAVRYAWSDNPTCNLYNGAGFPASPFRTDDFPPITP